MNNPILSIIVAVYNTSSYLEKCLCSLLSQELKDIEIICVNDASTDNSLEILNHFATRDDRIVVIDLKENVKLGGARNRGIEVAKGKYIGFVDSDDFVSPKMYSTLIDASENMSVDIVTPMCYANYSSRGETIKYQFPFSNTKVNEVKTCDVQREIVKSGCRVWASVFKTQYIRDNRLFFAEKVFYEDFPMFFSLFFLTDSIRVVDNVEPLYFYRMDNNSSIVHGTFTNKKFIDRITGAALMYKDAKKVGIDKSFRKELEFKIYCTFYQNTMGLLLFRAKKYPYESIRRVYREYKELMGSFPYNSHYYKKFGLNNLLFRLIGRFPVIGLPIRFIHGFVFRIRQ